MELSTSRIKSPRSPDTATPVLVEAGFPQPTVHIKPGTASINTRPTCTDSLSYWEPPSSLLGCLLYNTLCLIAFGYPTMDKIRQILYDSAEKHWEEAVSQMYIRLGNIIMVAGLLLATAAAFITTPPPDKSLFDYNQRGPYICIMGSFGLNAGGITVGSCALLVLARLQRQSMLDTFCADRLRIFCTLVMLAYPAIAVAVAALLLAFGLLSAVWCAEDVGMQGAGIIALVLPCTMAAIFSVVYCTRAKGVQTDTSTEGKNEALPV
ncbi:hypothetical protein CYLTODRAFT_453608 [Cylindrobasidium torrendii FP15055 ss-10]|uniref:Uncharacterized protein n=1 Tax=Cylindrobasidium torrendii FP15055 ss-10 TaxID=1314674 RepID=A0A0D7BFF5_9AGAR|nr:hypothetical protein CYLTODRAFT_453608 [Cylindrobasidium torrendii FP15055 ss-10]